VLERTSWRTSAEEVERGQEAEVCERPSHWVAEHLVSRALV